VRVTPYNGLDQSIKDPPDPELVPIAHMKLSERHDALIEALEEKIRNEAFAKLYQVHVSTVSKDVCQANTIFIGLR
jgi:hypothetical protein